MTEDIATPSKIWIITGESDLQKTPTGARSSSDIGGRLGEKERPHEVAATERSQVDVSKLKLEMQGFLKAMREMLVDILTAVNGR
jgi:predicted CopG family antitoxin